MLHLACCSSPRSISDHDICFTRKKWQSKLAILKCSKNNLWKLSQNCRKFWKSNFIKERLQHNCFFANLVKIFGAVFSRSYADDVFSLNKKMRFSIKDFFGKYDQIRRKLRIWSLLLKKLLMENFIFWAGFSHFVGCTDVKGLKLNSMHFTWMIKNISDPMLFRSITVGNSVIGNWKFEIRLEILCGLYGDNNVK